MHGAAELSDHLKGGRLGRCWSKGRSGGAVAVFKDQDTRSSDRGHGILRAWSQGRKDGEPGLSRVHIAKAGVDINTPASLVGRTRHSNATTNARPRYPNFFCGIRGRKSILIPESIVWGKLHLYTYLSTDDYCSFLYICRSPILRR